MIINNYLIMEKKGRQMTKLELSKQNNIMNRGRMNT